MSLLTKYSPMLCSQIFKPVAMLVNCYSINFDRKGGYNHRIKRPVKEKIKHGYEIFKEDIGLFSEEMRDKWREDRMISAKHKDYEYFWKFDGKDSIEPWICTTDRDNLEGFSKAELVLSKTNKALFHGYLCQRIPKDGILTSTGYVNISSPLNMKSFRRVIPYDWSMFTHILLRFRGDGRPYMMNILMDRYYDINWFDMYNFPLFSRGGPYWQVAKVPFSKFFLAYKGRIQDDQRRLDLQHIKSFSITLADRVEGPFKLEIDYIGLIFDESHEEEFAYELYEHEGISAL